MNEIKMKIFQAELSGIITRDIIWREVDAVDEAQARAMFAEALPGYRLRSIVEVNESGLTGFDAAWRNGRDIMQPPRDRTD